MGIATLPPVGALRQMLRYDPETGQLFWRVRDVSQFNGGVASASAKCARWNSRFADKLAFTAVTRAGKRRGQIGSRTYMAHRVIWAIVHGRDPGRMEIDHIDGDQLNNKISNLRLATRPENARNRGSVRGSSSGFKGVSAMKDGRWYACIQVDGKSRNLGTFKDEVSAAISYNEAAKRHFGDFARLNDLR